MGFLDKVKDFIKKFKEENAGFGKAMMRINAPGFCGNVNRGVNGGDFWNGSYISIENNKCVIYGSNQEDYFFSAEDVKTFEIESNKEITVSKGNEKFSGRRYIITFNDGKRAQADIIDNMIDNVKNVNNYHDLHAYKYSII